MFPFAASNPIDKLNQLPNGHHFSRRGAILCNPHPRRQRPPRPLQLAAQQQPDQRQQDISTPPLYMTRRYNKKSKWREPIWEVPIVPEPSSEPTTPSSPSPSSYSPQPLPPQQQLSDTLASLQSQLDQLTSTASIQMTSIKSQLEELAATTTSKLEDVTTTTVSQQWIPAVHSFSTWTKQQLGTAIDQLKSIELAFNDATKSGQSEIASTLNEISEIVGQQTQSVGVLVESSKAVGEQAGQTVGKWTGDLTDLSQQVLEEVGKTATEIRGEIGPQLESTLDMLKKQMDVAGAQIQQLGDQIKMAISSSHSSSSACGDKTSMQQQKNKKAMIIDTNGKKTKKKKVVIATAPTTTTATTPGPRNGRYAAFWNKMIELRDTALDAVESATVSVEDMAIKIKQTIIGTGTGSSKGVATKKTATIQTPTPTITKKKSIISTDANSSSSSSNSSSAIMKKNNIIRQRILSIAEPTKSSIDSVLTEIPPKAKSVATSPITAGILTVAAIAATSKRWLMRKRAETADKRALEAEAAKRSAYLAKQRARFRAALANGDEEGEEDKFKGSVDRSIYSAVSRIASSSTHSTSTSSSGSDEDEEEEEEEDDEAPPVYDKETLKAWAAFVKGSKMEQGQMWVSEDVDQGMPEIYIDLNRDRDDDDDM